MCKPRDGDLDQPLTLSHVVPQFVEQVMESLKVMGISRLPVVMQGLEYVPVSVAGEARFDISFPRSCKPSFERCVDIDLWSLMMLS